MSSAATKTRRPLGASGRGAPGRGDLPHSGVLMGGVISSMPAWVMVQGWRVDGSSDEIGVKLRQGESAFSEVARDLDLG